MSRPPRTLYFVLPGDRHTRTGGYLYDTRIAAELEGRGWLVHWVSLGAGFPFPSLSERAQARDALAQLPDGALTLVDGLALGVLDAELARERERLALVALVHHPLSLETGLSDASAAALEASESRALRFARRVIVTSACTRYTLGRPPYCVGPDSCAVVSPGTHRAPLAPGSPPGAPFELLCVATLTPRKGHAILLEALARLRVQDWRLTLAGDERRDAQTARAVREQTRALGLRERVRFAGELSEAALDAAYARADLFVSASWFEGYGMALAEALARGIAVIGARGGAAADTVPGDAGLLVEPGDAGALAGAIDRVLRDASLRASLVEGARRARRALPDWSEAAVAFELELDSVPIDIRSARRSA